MIALFVILNLAIATFDAWAVGHGWAESKLAGGWARVVAWSGAVMSVCGYLYSFSIIFAVVLSALNVLPDKSVQAILDLTYLIVIFPVLGAGLAIALDAWAYTFRNRSLLSAGVSAYNTSAMIYDTVQALHDVPVAFGDVIEFFFGSDSDSSEDDYASSLMVKVAVCVVVLVALFCSVGITFSIINRVARQHAFDLANQSWLAAAR